MLNDTIKNSKYSVLTELLNIPLGFISRYFLLKYIGVELVGTGSTILSIIGVMALAEGGFGTAIAYSLYKPLEENDHVKINKLINACRCFYNVLAVATFLIGVLVYPFIDNLLTGVTVTAEIKVVYFMYCINSSFSYLLGYKRILLYADIKEYITRKIDFVCSFSFKCINILALIVFKNYLVYVFVLGAETVAKNVFISEYCKRLFPFLTRERVEKGILKEMMQGVKNLFAGSLAGYVYNSTDNIIISKFVSTADVGYLSNYTMVTTMMKTLSARVLAPITPAIGRKLAQSEKIEEKRILFFRYYQVCYILALLICVPTLVLLDNFIINVYGIQYKIDPILPMLLVVIMYVYIAPFAYGDFIVTSGEFKILRDVEILGASVNLASSLFLVILIGIKGVLVGTILSVVTQWVVRSYVVYIKILKFSKWEYLIWFFKGVYRSFIFITSFAISVLAFKCLSVSTFLLRFTLGGVLTCAITVIAYILLYRFNDRFKMNELEAIIRNFRK